MRDSSNPRKYVILKISLPLLKTINNDKCNETFENFLILHNKEVGRLKGNKNISSIAI